MADSIRELIFQNIKTTLQGILQRDGYENNIDAENVILIHGKRDDSAYKEPIIYIYPGQERTNLEKGEKGYDYNELEVQIEAFIRGTKDTMNTNINKMLADLKKALGADHTRGGYAVDTIFIGNESFLTDLTSEKAGIVLALQVDYEHKYGNPYEN
jgi:hypothetical protein